MAYKTVDLRLVDCYTNSVIHRSKDQSYGPVKNLPYYIWTNTGLGWPDRSSLIGSLTLMTLPDERYRSLLQTERFLQELMDPKVTPRVPRIIRQRASSLLKHWPNRYHLEKLPDALPRDFAHRLDPLVRMVLEHQEEQQ